MGENGTACLVYMSPAGTTRKVGREIAGTLQEWGYRTHELDLGRAVPAEVRRFVSEDLAGACLLVVGSPVYASHVLYPVASFLEELPAAHGTPALVYATFGGVSAGASLAQMTEALRRRGYRVKGAARVLCVHSLFFRSGHPLGRGHPDESDWSLLREWLEAARGRLSPGDARVLDPRTAYTSKPLVRLLTSTFINMRVFGAIMPRYRFSSARCRRCGACQERCPSGRLDVLPPPRGRDGCLFCMECVRACPSAAFDAPMWMTQAFIRGMRLLLSRPPDRLTGYYL